MNRISLTQICRHVLSGYVSWDEAHRVCRADQRRELLRGQISLGTERADAIQIVHPAQLRTIRSEGRAADRLRKRLSRFPDGFPNKPRLAGPSVKLNQRQRLYELLGDLREARTAYAEHRLDEAAGIAAAVAREAHHFQGSLSRQLLNDCRLLIVNAAPKRAPSSAGLLLEIDELTSEYFRLGDSLGVAFSRFSAAQLYRLQAFLDPDRGRSYLNSALEALDVGMAALERKTPGRDPYIHVVCAV
jgi:hypothetical protein